MVAVSLALKACVKKTNIASCNHDIGHRSGEFRLVPVPLENRIRLVTCRSSAWVYSLIRPPRIGFRQIRSLSMSVMVARGASGSSSGTRWDMPWCGRAVL